MVQTGFPHPGGAEFGEGSVLRWLWTLKISNFTLGTLCQQSGLACKYQDFFRRGDRAWGEERLLQNPLVTDTKEIPPPSKLWLPRLSLRALAKTVLCLM